MSTQISESKLQELGFSVEVGGHDFEVWSKCGIDIWDWNGQYWLVDMLDQAGIHREFRLIEELEQFFVGCGLSLNKSVKGG